MPSNPKSTIDSTGVRLDKWLWVARFFKTRSLASEEISKNRVQVNGLVAKASRELRVGDRVELRQNQIPRTVIVRGLSQMRGSATVAGLLFEETPESVAARERLVLQRQLAPEPAQSQVQGRPTKRDRRLLNDWNRWSASIGPDE
ncbi:MAG: RNA-binding S4 domain-containing protein [Burkholderiales bacterium]